MNRAEKLLAWYDSKGRHLPWRSDPTPYHCWLSEIMLQQTRVETVMDYYHRFLKAFPDIPSLAAGSEDQVLKLWEGLGYYSRGRNLLKGARQVMADYGGIMPGTKAKLLTITGIGDYTASAIASIAFGEKTPALDGNLLRVYSRLAGDARNARSAPFIRDAESFYLELMDQDASGRYGAINQAFMDLGAMVCLPRERVRCQACPLREHCVAAEKGEARNLPVLPGKKERVKEEWTILLIYQPDRLALVKRPSKGLLAGMYAPPQFPGILSREEALRAAESLGITAVRARELGVARHIFSHVEWSMLGYEIKAADDPLKTKDDKIRFVPMKDAKERYAVPSAYMYYLDELRRSAADEL